MKKMLVFVLWAFVSIAYAQEYKPMLTDGKEWLCMLEIEGSPDGADGKWPYKITVCGESVEDGRIFKKLKKEYTDSVPKNEQKSLILWLMKKTDRFSENMILILRAKIYF